MSVVAYRNPSEDVSRVSNGTYSPRLPSETAWKENSFKSSFFNNEDFFDDVFSRTRNLFGHMDRMMGSMMRDPFGGDPFFQGTSPPALTASQSMALTLPGQADPFGFSNFGSLMPSMESMARGGACHSYSSSSVMTMTTGPDGRPQVYQATSSSRGEPGAVRETHRTVADSRSGVRKMAIGRQIGDRTHVIEKELGKDGDMEERQEFVNLDEEEAPEFDREFRQRTQQSLGALEYQRSRFRNGRASASSPSRQRYLPALPSSSRNLDSHRRRSRPALAIASASSRADNTTRNRGRGGATRIRRGRQ